MQAKPTACPLHMLVCVRARNFLRLRHKRPDPFRKIKKVRMFPQPFRSHLLSLPVNAESALAPMSSETVDAPDGLRTRCKVAESDSWRIGASGAFCPPPPAAAISSGND